MSCFLEPEKSMLKVPGIGDCEDSRESREDKARGLVRRPGRHGLSLHD